MIVLLKRATLHFMIRILIISLFLAVTLPSCEKDEDPTLFGSWQLENYTEKEYDNSVLINTVVEPGAGIAYEFRTDGQLIITTPGNPDITLIYTLPSPGVLEISGQTFEIRDLADHSMTLYDREDYGPGSYEEAYINLRR